MKKALSVLLAIAMLGINTITRMADMAISHCLICMEMGGQFMDMK